MGRGGMGRGGKGSRYVPILYPLPLLLVIMWLFYTELASDKKSIFGGEKPFELYPNKGILLMNSGGGCHHT